MVLTRSEGSGNGIGTSTVQRGVIRKMSVNLKEWFKHLNLLLQ